MRARVLVPSLAIALLGQAQHILHYTETSGFDHGTRSVSFALFQSIAAAHGWSVTDDANGDHFTTGQLAEFDAVVFSNTTGAAILDAGQRAAFEAWVAAGGRVLGIHSATDTYRHSTANGNNTGVWDFYAELMGASVQEGPNHVSGTPQYAMEHIGEHASTAHLPDPWEKNEEYYYWEGGYYGPNNTEVLRVEATVGPNGLVNSYDAPRPMSWYRELPGNGRVFYTALGHAASNYTDDALFRTHLEDALLWLLDGTSSVPDRTADRPSLFPVPADEALTVHARTTAGNMLLTVTDATGRILYQARVAGPSFLLPLSSWPPGAYLLSVDGSYPAPFVIMR